MLLKKLSVLVAVDIGKNIELVLRKYDLVKRE